MILDGQLTCRAAPIFLWFIWLAFSFRGQVCPSPIELEHDIYMSNGVATHNKFY